jgi:hypothetical protein
MMTLPNDVLLDLFDGGEEEYVQQLEEDNTAVARYLSTKRKRHSGSRSGKTPLDRILCHRQPRLHENQVLRLLPVF